MILLFSEAFALDFLRNVSLVLLVYLVDLNLQPHNNVLAFYK